MKTAEFLETGKRLVWPRALPWLVALAVVAGSLTVLLDKSAASPEHRSSEIAERLKPIGTVKLAAPAQPKKAESARSSEPTKPAATPDISSKPSPEAATAAPPATKTAIEPPPARAPATLTHTASQRAMPTGAQPPYWYRAPPYPYGYPAPPRPYTQAYPPYPNPPHAPSGVR